MFITTPRQKGRPHAVAASPQRRSLSRPQPSPSALALAHLHQPRLVWLAHLLLGISLWTSICRPEPGAALAILWCFLFTMGAPIGSVSSLVQVHHDAAKLKASRRAGESELERCEQIDNLGVK